MTEYDILVLGGGPAGTAAAITLARAGHSVVLLEKSAYEDTRIGETLPPRVRMILTSLGVWDRFVAAGHATSPGIVSIWGETAPFERDFIFNPYGHGWHVDRRRFDAMLAAAATQAGARLCYGAKLIACAPHAFENGVQGWQHDYVVGRARRQAWTRFVVDATGRTASFARRQRAHRLGSDRLVGLAAVVPAESAGDDIDRRTLVEAVEEGWWYSAALPGSRLIAVYMTDADLLPPAPSRLDFWQERLNQTRLTRKIVGPSTRLLASPPGLRVVAANSSWLNATSGRNWIAVGDAALAFDPLASHGILHAVTSGMNAGNALQRCLAGELWALGEYDAREHQVRREYERLFADYYAREQRWPSSRFWHRRHVAAIRARDSR